MKKIFLCTPAHYGKVTAEYAVSLSDTACLLAKNKIKMDIRISVSGSMLCFERNKLTAAFMDSDCTHILMVDSDIGWDAKCILNMLSKDVDFLVGCYKSRHQNNFIFTPCLNEDGSFVVNKENNLLKMMYVPAGFMLIKKCVIEKMMKAYPELAFTVKNEKKTHKFHGLFNSEVKDGKFWGEDYGFCKKASSCGIDIWCDPNIKINHAGNVGILSEIFTENKK